MCKEDTIVIRTYIHIYIFFLKNRFLDSILVPYCLLFNSLFLPEEALVTAHESFRFNEIQFITCVYFISLFIPHSVYLLSVFLYHWIHPTLVFCGMGCTVLPSLRRTGAADGCRCFDEIPREVFVVLVLCGHPRLHPVELLVGRRQKGAVLCGRGEGLGRETPGRPIRVSYTANVEDVHRRR